MDAETLIVNISFLHFRSVIWIKKSVQWNFWLERTRTKGRYNRFNRYSPVGMCCPLQGHRAIIYFFSSFSDGRRTNVTYYSSYWLVPSHWLHLTLTEVEPLITTSLHSSKHFFPYCLVQFSVTFTLNLKLNKYDWHIICNCQVDKIEMFDSNAEVSTIISQIRCGIIDRNMPQHYRHSLDILTVSRCTSRLGWYQFAMSGKGRFPQHVENWKFF